MGDEDAGALFPVNISGVISGGSRSAAREDRQANIKLSESRKQQCSERRDVR